MSEAEDKGATGTERADHAETAREEVLREMEKIERRTRDT